MLNSALQELRAVIHAEMGFIMLYNQIEERLELRATTHDDLFRVSPHYEAVDRVANETLQRAEMVCYNNLGDVLRSIATNRLQALPLQCPLKLSEDETHPPPSASAMLAEAAS